MSGQSKEPMALPILLPRVVGIAAAALVIAYAVTFRQLPTNEHPPAWGAFGDFVGGLLNPLVSTFTLIVAARVWQLQKHELAATQQELAIQRGQERFFDLMNIYFRTVDSISHTFVRSISVRSADVTDKVLRGELPPDRLYKEVGNELVSLIGKAAISQKIDELESLDDEDLNIPWRTQLSKAIEPPTEAASLALVSLKETWIEQQTNLHLTHYFNVVTLLLAEARHLLGAEEHHRYVALFVAQLHPDELVVLGYYMWLDPNGHALTRHAQTYGLLQNMTKRNRSLSSVLPQTAFARPSP